MYWSSRSPGILAERAESDNGRDGAGGVMLDIWQQLQSFMGRGGPVLWVILALLVLMSI